MITPAALSEHVAGASSVDGDRSVMLLRGQLTYELRLLDREEARAKITGIAGRGGGRVGEERAGHSNSRRRARNFGSLRIVARSP